MPQVNTPCPKNIYPMGYRLASMNKQVRLKAPLPHLIAEVPISLNNIHGIEQDYIDLFTYARKGHMAKYVYMNKPYIYDRAIKQDAYYPFKMECELLTKKVEEIVKCFRDVTEAIEVGPGSRTPVMAKTVPLLEALERCSSFSSYKAIDSNLEYARQACQIIKEKFKMIKAEALEFDFLSKNEFKNIKNYKGLGGNKILFSFGQSIFASNNDKGISNFLYNVGDLLQEDDHFLFGVDTNKDENMLEGAYNNNVAKDLISNIAYFLKSKINTKYFNPEYLEPIYKWNREESSVEHFLLATSKQILNIGGQKIIIEKGSEFNVLNSRKLDLNKIESFLIEGNFQIKEIITLKNNYRNKFSLVRAQKNGDYC